MRRSTRTAGKKVSSLFLSFLLVLTSVSSAMPFFVSDVARAAEITDRVVINEIVATPTAGSTEWIELYNPTASPINLAGWTVRYNNNVDVYPVSAGSIAAKGFVLVEAPDAVTSYLSDASDTIRLLNAASAEQDVATYSNIPQGSSYGRIYDAASTYEVKSTPSKQASNGSAPVPAPVPVPTANTICSDVTVCQYATVSAAVAAAPDGTTLILKENQTVSSLVTFNRAITLDGEGNTLFVSGGGHRLALRAAVTLRNMNITKTDAASQNIVLIAGPGVILDGINVNGQYQIGDNPVARALEISANDFLVKNSTFSNLRQPGYINGYSGRIENSRVSVSRGWVVTGNSNVTFTGNTWSNNNPNDIAIIDDDGDAATTAINNYSCEDVNAIIANNNNAVVDHQLLPRPCAPAPASPTTEVVRESDLNGWVKLNDSGQGGTAAFQTGPQTPPVGTGSVEMTAANADSDFALSNYSWANTFLKDIAALQYSSFKKSGASGPVAFSLNFDTDLTDSNVAWQGRLTYEPTYANATADGEWQTFDSMLTDRAWWFSNGTVRAQLNCDQTAANLCTLDEIVAKFPKGGIRASDGAILLRVDGSWTDYRGNVDALTLATGTRNVTYDFENEIPDTTAPTVPSNGAPNNTYIPTNTFNFTWDASFDASSQVTYEFQSSRNPAQQNGVLTNDVWKSGVLTSPSIYSSGASDGTWYWQVRATDAEGNVSSWSPIWNVTLDTQKPTVEITSPTSNRPVAVGVSNRKVAITGTAADTSNFNYYYCYVTNVNGAEVGVRDAKCQTAWAAGTPSKTAFANSATGTVNGALGSVDLAGVADGVYTVHVVAKDKAGNTLEATQNFVLDTAPPVITSVNVSEGDRISGTKTLTMSTDESYPKTYNIRVLDTTGNPVAVNGTNLGGYDSNNTSTTYSYNFDTTKVPEGDYRIQFSARDEAGNPATTVFVGITVDNTPPTSDVDVTRTSDTEVLVTLTTSEPVQDIAGWTKVNAITFTKTESVSGEYTVVFTDTAGNEGKDTYSVDLTPPSVAFEGITRNEDGTYLIQGTTSSASDRVDVFVNGVRYTAVVSNAATWSVVANLVESLNGTVNTISAQSTDVAGNSRMVYYLNDYVAFTPYSPLESVPLPLANAEPITSIRTSSATPRTTYVASVNTASQDNTDAEGSVLGTKVTKGEAGTRTAAIEPSEQGWKLFGLSWYWWVVIVAALAAAGWTARNWYLNRTEA